MSRFKNLADAQRAHINTLRALLAGVLVICLAFWYGWKTAPQHLTVHVPPDLRTGSTRLWWDIPPENIYSFALYVFQQINRWPNDGEKDYKRAVFALQNYLTPSCRAYLERDYENRQINGELRGRVRGVYEILGRGYANKPALRVRQLDKDSWRVNLDLNADEYYLTEAVKRTAVRYPLRVVRYDVDTESNPYGLALDCYDGTPQRLEVGDERGEQPSTPEGTAP